MAPNPTPELAPLTLDLLAQALAPTLASLPALLSCAVVAICSLLQVLVRFGLHAYIYATSDRQARVNPRGVHIDSLFSSAIIKVALGGVAAGWAFKIGRKERRAVKARARAGAGPGPA